MQHRYRLLLVAGAFVAATAAHAQLKPSGSTGLTPRVTSLPAPAAAPSATPQPAAAASGAQADPEKEKAGQTAAHAWLILLDRRDWGSAWDASSAVFRQSVPLPGWMENIPKVRTPFGNLVEREPAQAVYKTTLAGRPDGDYVSVIFVSKFEKKPNIEETVTTVREPDGRWRVTGYTYAEK